MVGFDAKNKNILNLKFICHICSLIMCNPIQLLGCGHRQCKSCFDRQNDPTIRCALCSIETQRSHMMIDKGFENDMQSLGIECPFCRWCGTLKYYQKHLDESHPNPTCEYCGERFHSVNKLSEHKVLACQHMTVDCLLKDFGCDEPIARCNIAKHYSNEPHLNSLSQVINRIRLQVGNASKLSTRSTTVEIVDPDIDLFQELCKILNIPLDDLNVLSDDGQQGLNNSLFECQSLCPTLTRNFLQVKLSEKNSSYSDEPTVNQEILPYVPCDGTFVWKITNFKEKMTDAQSERQTSIYSSPFYSSPAGYKMRAELWLNGIGSGHHTHMSLFFQLMRGLNDPILKFPFKYKVAFCLYDQTPAKQHIIKSFRPDITSSSFQRPESEMNITSGIPKFVSLTTIHEEGNPYIRDDTIFIKVLVDFGEMPKMLLSYALSLNPGLPIDVQQEMIKQEMKRRGEQYQETADD